MAIAPSRRGEWSACRGRRPPRLQGNGGTAYSGHRRRARRARRAGEPAVGGRLHRGHRRDRREGAGAPHRLPPRHGGLRLLPPRHRRPADPAAGARRGGERSHLHPDPRGVRRRRGRDAAAARGGLLLPETPGPQALPARAAAHPGRQRTPGATPTLTETRPMTDYDEPPTFVIETRGGGGAGAFLLGALLGAAAALLLAPRSGAETQAEIAGAARRLRDEVEGRVEGARDSVATRVERTRGGVS